MEPEDSTSAKSVSKKEDEERNGLNLEIDFEPNAQLYFCKADCRRASAITGGVWSPTCDTYFQAQLTYQSRFCDQKWELLWGALHVVARRTSHLLRRFKKRLGIGPVDRQKHMFFSAFEQNESKQRKHQVTYFLGIEGVWFLRAF